MSGHVGSICLVANDFAYVVRNGGVGTHFWELAHTLAHAGWAVHVLYCGPVEAPDALVEVPRRLAKARIGFSYLHAFPMPKALGIEVLFGEPQYLLDSEKVRHVLEELHREHRFDLIEFAEWGAMGFRTIQAKLSGSAFPDVGMIVKLHSSSQWQREGNLTWMVHADDSRRDFCERYAFENATVQMSPSQYMLDYARSVHWKVRPDAQVLPYPFPEPLHTGPAHRGSATPEIVFFGRLEARKGLEVFIEAAQKLDAGVRLRFLGKDTRLANGALASRHISAQLPGRELSLLTGLNWEQALTYLSEGNRLAVLPSLADNLPYTVIECAVNGIPFIASRVGGIPEIIPDAELQAKLLFEPHPADLLRCLKRYLEADPAERQALREKARTITEVAGNHRQVAEGYRSLRTANPQRPSPDLTDGPLVTICVPFYNLGAYLPEALASLAAQSYSKLDVLVIDDGSTDAASRRVFEEQQRLYPQFRFVHQDNVGVSATRNRGIAEAAGEYFIPLDADNIVVPRMVERFVTAIRHRPDVSAISCYFLAFRDTADLSGESFAYAYRPTGGPHVIGSIQNVYGDATAIYRVADLRAVGGYETEDDSATEDWELFVKLVNAGRRVDVVPEYLFYYRHRDNSRIRSTNRYGNHRRVLRQYSRAGRLPEAEQMALWTALVSLHVRLGQHRSHHARLRYRMADELMELFHRFPRASRVVRPLLFTAGRACRRIMSRIATTPR